MKGPTCFILGCLYASTWWAAAWWPYFMETNKDGTATPCGIIWILPGVATFALVVCYINHAIKRWDK